MEKPMNNSSSEIDLLQLLTSVLDGISRLISLIWKHILVFLGIFLLIGVLGYGIRYIIPRHYVTKAVFVSRLLPANYCTYLINAINEQVKSTDAEALSTSLHISPNIAYDLNNISAEAIEQDTSSLDKDDPEAAGFAVILTLNNMQNLDTIQSGLIRCLEENNYTKTRNEAKQRDLLSMKNTLSERISSLDTLKKLLYERYSSPRREQGIIFGEPADPVAVYKEEMKYYKEQQIVNNKLSDPHSIQVLQPFVKLSKPNEPNVQKIFKLSLAGGLLLALVFTPFYGWNKQRKTAA